MAQQADVSVALKPYAQGMRILGQVRQNLMHTFDFLAEGLKSGQNDGEDETAIDHKPSTGNLAPENIFSKELKQRLGIVMESFDRLEKLVALLPPQKGQLQCGNLGVMMHNYISDQNTHYKDSVATYNWTKKLQDYSNFAFRYMSPMVRINQSSKRVSPPSNPAVDLVLLNTKFFPALSKMFPGIDASVVQRGKNSFIALITLNLLANSGGEQIKSPVLKCAILMRSSYAMEWINVKGVDEDFFDDYGKLEVTIPSRHELFRKLSTHLKGCILHLNSQLNGQQPIRQFFTLLYMYRLIFSAPCAICKLYLKDNLPAYLRDTRLGPIVHETCR